MELHAEYREFLNNEIVEFDKELISILELPSANKLCSRIKKDKRDTKAMLELYSRIEHCNILIQSAKAEGRSVIRAMRNKLEENKGIK